MRIQPSLVSAFLLGSVAVIPPASPAETPAAVVAAPAPTPIDLDQACYLMVHLLTHCPPANRAKLWDETQFLYDFLQPNRQPPWTAAEIQWVENNTRTVLAEAAAQYSIIRVGWTPTGLVHLGGTVEVAIGVRRHFLIEVTNQTTTDMDFDAAFQQTLDTLYPGYRVPAGQSRMMIAGLQLAAPTANGKVDLVIEPLAQPGSRRTLQLPVTTVAPAILRGTLLDAETGDPVAARVTVRGAENELHHAPQFASNATLSQKQFLTMPQRGSYFKVPFFYANGSFELPVMPGETVISVERGFEHATVSQTVTAVAGQTTEVTLRPARTLDARARGWVSGDTHVHWVKNYWSENEDLELLRMVQRAEDLRVINNLTLYQYVAPPGESFTKPDHFPMGPVPGMAETDYHVQMGEEFRNDDYYGHICLLGIKELITPVATGRGSGGPQGTPDYPTNKWVIEQAHAQGGIVTEAHNLGGFNRGSMPANVVLGLADSVDQLMPEHYYRFLDSGVHVPISDGSDHPARIAGEVRVYVKVDPAKPLFDGWIDGIRERNTFTTSGPLLFLTVNGQPPGAAMNVTAGSTIEIRVEAFSRRPIGNLQLVSNGGRILAQQRVTETSATLTFNTVANEPFWVVARSSPNNNYYALVQRDVAHTSGVFVDVGGRRKIDPAAVNFWIQILGWNLTAVETQATFATPAQKAEAVAYVRSGIEAFQALLLPAKTGWQLSSTTPTPAEGK